MRSTEYEEEKGGGGDAEDDEGFVAIVGRHTGTCAATARKRTDSGKTEGTPMDVGPCAVRGRQSGTFPCESKGSAPAFPVADQTCQPSNGQPSARRASGEEAGLQNSTHG